MVCHRLKLFLGSRQPSDNQKIKKAQKPLNDPKPGLKSADTCLTNTIRSPACNRNIKDRLQRNRYGSPFHHARARLSRIWNHEWRNSENENCFKRLRQAKHRNIAVMAMEAEKMEESSKRLELSVSISQDALEVDHVDEDDDSSRNIDCSRQVPPLIFPDFQSARFPPNFD